MRRSIWVLAILSVMSSASALAATTELPATGDTYIQSDTPTASFGSSGITAVAASRTTLIRFNPQAIASAADGSTATLKVKVVLSKNASNAVTVRLVQSNWNEGTVTYNTRPTISSSVLAQRTITKADEGKIVTFDVSAAIAGWKSNPATNFGVAITAASPTPNLQLGSREGGAAATLSIERPAATNHVLVAPTGGDYTDPVEAANNALVGDHWCVSPQLPASPCTMKIAAGIYVLQTVFSPPLELSVSGESQEETILVAAKHLNIAVVSRATSLSDLTIIDHQPDDIDATALILRNIDDIPAVPPVVTRVTVSASGSFATALEVRDPFALSDLTLSAHGGATVGIEMNSPAPCTRCVVDSVGEFATGVRQNPTQQRLPGMVLDQSTVTVLGGSSASVGVEVRGVDGATIKNSTIAVRADVGTRAVTLHEGGPSTLLIMNSSLIADGPAGLGLEHNTPDSETTLDGVRVFGSKMGIFVNYPGPATLHVLRSRVQSPDSGILGIDFHKIDVTDSVVRAPKWFAGSDATVTATDSVLDGATQNPGGSVTCTRVYDSAYHLSNTCPAPPAP